MYGLIQIIEAAFDAVEYRMALRARGRAERRKGLAGARWVAYRRGGRAASATQLASLRSEG